ncbi:ABC transporter permease [Nocardioides perillae]|uniref:Simple sugar transport system permease protein n=1 Tax=Nocardioides perillae TaxID=1119534 RepID=A0A7Y9UK89_9ACTN|nr:ABC transporter permease [Nocardioides perillae]NYG55108.1 simple sugar transport system permease protein [Nocardioides perillae]
MTTASLGTRPAEPAGPTDDGSRVALVSRKAPAAFTAVTAALALALVLAAQPGDTTYRLRARGDLATLPDLTVPSMATAWVLVVVMAVLSAASWLLLARRRRTPLPVVAAFSLVAVVAFLTWAAAGGTVPLVGLLGGAVALAVPLVFGALGGVVGERAGVVNIAIDGQLLLGAFAAALVGSLTGSTWAGLVAAMVAGVLVAAVLAVFAITYLVDQVIVGVVLNVLVIGLTSFLFTQVLAEDTARLNSPPRFDAVAIPLLGDLPLLGPVLFRQTPVVYLMYVLVAATAFALYRTRWGLRLRAVGEHPKAADTVGIDVLATRYRAVLLAGAMAGAGGAFYTLVSVPQFNREMTGGAGYIALAAVIFGTWDPVRATLAALLFGFASNLQGVLSAVGSPVPSQFLLMLPYVVTIFAVAGLVGRSRPPAADGVPYVKQ